MSSYKELVAQREELERKIQEVRQRESADAIAKVHALIQDYGLTAAEIFPPVRAAGTTSKVAAKYRNPETNETWTGRGKAPKWIQGKEREQFLIAA